MKLKVPLIVKAIFYSALLFVLWILIERYYVAFLSDISSTLRGIFGASTVAVKKEEFSYYLIPALSLILASRDELSRKIKYMTIAIIAMIGYQVLSLSSGMAGLASINEKTSGDALGAVVSVIDHSFGWVFAILIALFYFRYSLSKALQKETSVETITRCPICGQAKTGLADHIRAVHGEKSLRQARVRRILEKPTGDTNTSTFT